VNHEELVSSYPVVYHTTAAGSWEAIRAHGLWTAKQIVSTARCDQETTEQVLTTRRLHAVGLTHPVLGAVRLRDQAPLRLDVLARSLTDLSVEQWLALLSNRVFFWLHLSRVETLLSGRRNREHEHDVITVDTASLISAHRDRIRLSPINSGAALYPNAAHRGSDTFRTIADYPFAQRRRTRPPSTAIAELAVIDGVHDIAAHTVDVRRWRGPAHTS
jgi:hypothetical protein